MAVVLRSIHDGVWAGSSAAHPSPREAPTNPSPTSCVHAAARDHNTASMCRLSASSAGPVATFSRVAVRRSHTISASHIVWATFHTNFTVWMLVASSVSYASIHSCTVAVHMDFNVGIACSTT